MIGGLRARPALLALLPLAIYVGSYIYLAWYHGTIFLFGTIVHESGQYTLLENALYAPHFLGHIPVHCTIALLMVGSYLALSPSPRRPTSAELRRASLAMLVFLAGCLALSAAHWGWTETWEFITQQRQRPDLLVPGGSWLLHFPSTLALILGVPLFVLAVRWFFDRPTRIGDSGTLAFLLGGVSILAITLLVVPDPFTTTGEVLRDPRYLGHSVRELATFPLIYFPLPLAWWLSREAGTGGFHWNRSLVVLTIAASLVVITVLAYQVIVTLNHGLVDLVQHPEFAGEKGLPIPYLLASHYFEHLLDTVFFALLCVLLMIPGGRRNG